MVAGYEVLRARQRPPEPRRRASHDEKRAMLGLLRQGLQAIRALPDQHSDNYFLEWEALFMRADLTPKEVGLLEHLARKMSQRGERP
jgi:tRNA C32,U32 (ribose-2'-O)-methylase TrmJ